MTDPRLPRAIEEFLLDVAVDPSQRDWRRRRLGFGGDAHMRDAFLEALSSPGIVVHAGACSDDPCEICVRAEGVDRDGRRWADSAILLLDPEWIRDPAPSQDLAEDVVDNWDRLRAFVLQ
jgi:hypothetical protein